MSELKKTPLFEVHERLGGKIIDFGGWALPVQYSSIKEEHNAVRNACGLFDVSHMGEIEVKGSDAFRYIQHIVTNDITSMKPGRCRYSPVCYENGGTVDDVLIYMFDEQHYLLVVNAGNTAKDFEWFQKNMTGFDVSVENHSSEWAQMALQGPRFMEVLEKLDMDGEVPAKNYTFTNVKIMGRDCIVSRTGYTGEDGVEVYCPAENAVAIYDAIMEAGRDLPLIPCGLGARDTLRFEASMPLYGHEITAEINPKEAGLNFAIKLTKEEFIGREALLGDVKRTRIGLKLIDRGVAREGYPVFVGDTEVGFVTSGSVAPKLGGNYAMALVNTEFASNDTFDIIVRGKRIRAEQVSLPFYKKG